MTRKTVSFWRYVFAFVCSTAVSFLALVLLEAVASLLGGSITGLASFDPDTYPGSSRNRDFRVLFGGFSLGLIFSALTGLCMFLFTSIAGFLTIVTSPVPTEPKDAWRTESERSTKSGSSCFGRFAGVLVGLMLYYWFKLIVEEPIIKFFDDGSFWGVNGKVLLASLVGIPFLLALAWFFFNIFIGKRKTISSGMHAGAALTVGAVFIFFTLVALHFRAIHVKTSRNEAAFEKGVAAFAEKVRNRRDQSLLEIEQLKSGTPLETAMFYKRCLDQGRFGDLILALPPSYKEDLQTVIAQSAKRIDLKDWKLLSDVLSSWCSIFRIFPAEQLEFGESFKPMKHLSALYLVDPVGASSSTKEAYPRAEAYRRLKAASEQYLGKRIRAEQQKGSALPEEIAACLWFCDSFQNGLDPTKLRRGEIDGLLLDPMLSGLVGLEIVYLPLFTFTIESVQSLAGSGHKLLLTFRHLDDEWTQQVDFVKMEDCWVPTPLVEQWGDILSAISDSLSQIVEYVPLDEEERRLLSEMASIHYPDATSLWEALVRCGQFLGLYCDFMRHGIQSEFDSLQPRIENIRNKKSELPSDPHRQRQYQALLDLNENILLLSSCLSEWDRARNRLRPDYLSTVWNKKSSRQSVISVCSTIDSCQTRAEDCLAKIESILAELE